MRLYAGIDLHANSNYLGIVDEENKIVFKHKLPNDLRKILAGLKPCRQQAEGVVVESTFNW
jgi:transposase